jgi:hypothetical protein
MSTTPEFQFPAPTTPAVEAPKGPRFSRKTKIVGGGIAALLLIAGIASGGRGAAESAPTTTVPVTTVAPSTTQAPTTTEAPTTTTEVEVTADDLRVELTETYRECFGSAGGLVTVLPGITVTTMNGKSLMDRSGMIIIEVTGGEDGVEKNSIDFTPGGDLSVPKMTISTPACDTPVTAKVVEVIIYPGSSTGL